MLAEWNLWHTNLGASFEVMNIEFTSGLGYTFGQATTESYHFLGTDDSSNEFVGYPVQKMTYKRLKFLIGFKMPFGTSPE